MRIVMFYHSLVSCWNHGNAHFLRGVVSELIGRGFDVVVYEPADGWSRKNLLEREGEGTIEAFHRVYPSLSSHTYALGDIDLAEAIDGADLVLVHEWNDHDLVQRLGELRAGREDFRLLFHDTHHRSVSAPREMANYDLSHYDGVLAFGEVIRQVYLDKGWAKAAWTWHEAADVHRFTPPIEPREVDGDLVWIGNWGDEERTAELHEFLTEPAAALGLTGTVHGVRYPAEALAILEAAGLTYEGWLPNFRVPEVFARHRVTVHIPRRFYVTHLPGVPTIRVFEALACGIPLICSPWEDAEGLFSPGDDYLVAQDGRQMRDLLEDVLSDETYARKLARRGRQTIMTRHTCAHRVDELMTICRHLGLEADANPRSHEAAAEPAV